MQITYIGLSECYQEIIERAEKSEYVWIMSLIARYADCENIYDKIEKDCESLNDLTGKKVLFLFSSPSYKEWSSFFSKRANKPYVVKGCPFVVMLDRKPIHDNNGGFRYNYPNYDSIDWKLKHSQTISEFARKYNILESQIPCLFFYNVRNKKRKVVPLNLDSDVYKLIKGILIDVNSYYDRLIDIETSLNDFQNIDNYIRLFVELNEKAESLDLTQKQAIQSVLTNQKMFLDVRNKIQDRKIKKELKRIKQWDRQFYASFLCDTEKYKKYVYLKREHVTISEKIDEKLDNIDLASCIANSKGVNGMIHKEKVTIFISYNWNDDNQANEIYDYFKTKQGIEIHKDKIDIGRWESIKEYMDSINEMDFVILLISDAYLKSVNCMYEVMEVMRTKRYQEKIFPVVIDKEIYEAVHRARYIKYWINEYNKLNDELKGIGFDALGQLGSDLKKLGNIKNNIADFLDTISTMNNPEVSGINEKIEQKLLENGVTCGNNRKVSDLEGIKNEIKGNDGLVPESMVTMLIELQKALINNKV